MWNCLYEIFKKINKITIGRGKNPVLLADKKDRIILYTIVKKIIEILNKPDLELEHLLLDKRKFNLNKKLVNSFFNSKDDFLDLISKGHKNLWSIEGFTLNRWKNFLQVIVGEIGAEIDEPVTIDIHRLIRYPGSLHGATGFKVQEIELKELEKFNPLNEKNEKLDPIIFKSKKIQKIEIIESFVPATKILGETYGPYNKGDKDTSGMNLQ